MSRFSVQSVDSMLPSITVRNDGSVSAGVRCFVVRVRVGIEK